MDQPRVSSLGGKKIRVSSLDIDAGWRSGQLVTRILELDLRIPP